MLAGMYDTQHTADTILALATTYADAQARYDEAFNAAIAAQSEMSVAQNAMRIARDALLKAAAEAVAEATRK